ncbi:hypothetical protein BDE02_06G238400 [Populus trichocarpa]|nr:hypothetical protein BDE02_06G238400 [Populus trichocarpa]
MMTLLHPNFQRSSTSLFPHLIKKPINVELVNACFSNITT